MSFEREAYLVHWNRGCRLHLNYKIQISVNVNVIMHDHTKESCWGWWVLCVVWKTQSMKILDHCSVRYYIMYHHHEARRSWGDLQSLYHDGYTYGSGFLWPMLIWYNTWINPMSVRIVDQLFLLSCLNQLLFWSDYVKD